MVSFADAAQTICVGPVVFGRSGSRGRRLSGLDETHARVRQIGETDWA